MADEPSTYRPKLPGLIWAKGIRDPLWGDIGMTEVETKITQTEAFTRLRGIKQLSFAYLAFPGAVHSRFEHSIGVMHATDQILKAVNQIIPMKPEHRQLLRLAALLHDIGHPPFSHAMENLFAHYPEVWREVAENIRPDFKKFMTERHKDYSAPTKHEDFTDYIICTDPGIQKVLKDWLESINKGSMEMEDEQKEAFIKNVVAKLAIGEEVTAKGVKEEYKSLSKIFKNVMSGDIDADKVDYLARDNYYCGLPYILELNSLRDRIAIRNGELVLLPDALKFVNTVILSRYFLITEVHQNPWDAFTTAKVVELLNGLLRGEANRAETIFEMFTTWDDSKLIDYLVKAKSNEVREILRTEYPLEKIGSLDYWDTHPYIREAIQVIAENEYHIPHLQNDLRQITGNHELFIHINRVKSPNFDMKVEGGNLLRNEILRGISEESLKSLQIVIYGKKDPRQTAEFKARIEKSIEDIDEQSEQIDDYIDHLKADPIKQLLAYLAIRRYRAICMESAKARKILAPDFLLLVMKAIKSVSENMESNGKKIENPTRQSIYEIARWIYEDLSVNNISINGHIKLNDREITPSFYREIRKYEQMGLISYSRKIALLESEDEADPQNDNRKVFRFDRRFELSKYGEQKLHKMHDLRTVVPEYGEYLTLWDVVEQSVDVHREKIEDNLTQHDHVKEDDL